MQRFANINISQGSVAAHLSEVGSLLIMLLQISSWVRRWKNYENRSIFSQDRPMDKSTVCGFLGHPV